MMVIMPTSVNDYGFNFTAGRTTDEKGQCDRRGEKKMK